jgi:hypothetical protein
MKAVEVLGAILLAAAALVLLLFSVATCLSWLSGWRVDVTTVATLLWIAVAVCAVCSGDPGAGERRLRRALLQGCEDA